MKLSGQFDMDFDHYHIERQRLIETQHRQVQNIQREIKIEGNHR